MKRLILLIFVWCALCLIVATAHGATKSPAPDGVGSDCSWQEAGQHMVIGDEEYVCHCARLTGPNGKQILCRWWNTETLPKPKKKPTPKPKPAKYGISTGVLSHA